MLDTILPVLKRFREKIYQFFPSRRDAAMELVDSLSSNKTARSIMELSLNPMHRRNYCSITRVLDEYKPDSIEKEQSQEKVLTNILSGVCVTNEQRTFRLFVVDCTPAPRAFSPTLEDRSYVYTPNMVCGNKPITIGHKYSIAAYLPEKMNGNEPPWVVPLSCKRVHTSEDSELVGMKQIADCIKSQHTFLAELVVSLGDTAYNKPLCLGVAKDNVNQVHISRSRNNRNFFYQYVSDNATKTKNRGRPKVYGDIHKLTDATTWRTPDDSIEFSQISSQGKIQIIKIDCWNHVIIRGKKNCKLSDYPLRLLRVNVYKENGELLFKRPFWLTAAGSRRMELSLLDIFNSYRQRFDIEHFFRFGKTRLLMDKIQTPDVNHEEAWWQLVMIAYTQLYLSREVADNHRNPWETSSFKLEAEQAIKQPTQVQKDFERLIREIGTPARPPIIRKIAPGRQMGDLQIKRTRYAIVKKGKKSLVDEKLTA
jgi:hypothetical protein